MNRNNDPKNWWDYTWNPITGCSEISEGCKHCYARAISRRFGWPWGRATFHPDRLDEPMQVRKPSLIFVCSMSDLGHETVEQKWLEAILRVIQHASVWHTFVILTKRPGQWLGLFAPYAWVGVTCETQADFNSRWTELLWWTLRSEGETERFISVEPMLEPVNAINWCALTAVDWVIAGPETGPGARPCKDAWIDALSRESGCFFDKRKNAKRREWPAAIGKEAVR